MRRLAFGLSAAMALSSGTAMAQLSAVTGDPTDAIVQAEAAIRAELLKATTTRKTVKEGLASYQAQQRLQDRANDIKERLRQPDLMCQTMSTQDNMSAAERKAGAAIYAGQRKVTRALGSNSNTFATLETSAKATNDRFCSEAEIARGVCKAPTDSKYANLAGADTDAMYLFQSRDGSNSYAGGRDGPQVEAVDAYIQRVVAGLPPEALRGESRTEFQRNPQARAYIELQRRYSAVLSMAAYSLNKIKESRNPQQ
jgi:hypothetical protein